MPSSIVLAAVGTAISESVLATIGAGMLTFAFSVSSFVTSLVLGGLGQALSKKPQSNQSLTYAAPNAQLSVKQSAAPWRVVYGEARIGGVITFITTSPWAAPNQILSMVITLTGHQVDDITDVYLDDVLVPIDWDFPEATNMVTGSRFAGYCFFGKRTGTASQTAYYDLYSYRAPGVWTANHRQRGRASLYAALMTSGVFNGSVPNITVICRGHNEIYDPRSATTGWSNNPALIVAHYLCEDTFGLGADYATEIDETALIAAANICDERVSAVYTPAFTADASTDQITFTVGNAQVYTGEPVKLSTTGGLPGGLATNTVYYLIRTSDTVGKLATTAANAAAGVAIDITTAGTGTHTMEHHATFNISATTANLIIFDNAERTMFTGDGVRCESTVTLPTGIASSSTTYYWIRKADGTGYLASSYANALAGTAISISGGAGVMSLRLYDTPRYTCNGSFTLDQKPGDILPKLLSSMAGSAQNIGGTWKIIAGGYVAPTQTITTTEIRGTVETQVFASRADMANSIKGVFVSPENGWQPTDFPTYSSATYVALDNNEVVWKDIELPFTTRTFMAQRLALIALNKLRNSLTVKLPAKLSAFRVQPGDTVNLTIAKYGWNPQVFEVVEGAFSISADGQLGYDMVLRQTSASVYTWTADQGAVLNIVPPTSLPTVDVMRSLVPPDVSGLQLFNSDSTTFSGRDMKFQWRVAATFVGEFGSEISGANSNSQDKYFKDFAVEMYNGSTLLRTEYVTDSFYNYTVEKNAEDNAGVPIRSARIQVKQRTPYGKTSDRAAMLTVSNVAPALPTLTLAGINGGFSVSFTIPTDIDYGGTRFYASLTEGFTPSSANIVATITQDNGQVTNNQITGLQPGLKYYVRAIPYDSFGDGTTSAEYSAITTNPVSTGYFGSGDAAGSSAVIASADTGASATAYRYAGPTFVPKTNLLYIVVDTGSGNLRLKVYDPVDMRLVVERDTGVSGGSSLFGMVYAPSTGYLYASQPGSAKLLVLDPVSCTLVKTLTMPGAGGYVAMCYSPLDGYVFFTDQVRVVYLRPVAETWSSEVSFFSASGYYGVYMPSADRIVVTDVSAKTLYFIKRDLSGSSTYAPGGATAVSDWIGYCPVNDRIYVGVNVGGTYTLRTVKPDYTLDATITPGGTTGVPRSPTYVASSGLMYTIEITGGVYGLYTYSPVTNVAMGKGSLPLTSGNADMISVDGVKRLVTQDYPSSTLVLYSISI